MTNIFKESTLNSLKKLIENKPKVVIVTHINPDGDAIGSTTAWKQYMEVKGINATIIVPNKFPLYLEWLDKNNEIIVYNSNVEKANACINEAEYIFCLDFNKLTRIDKLGEYIASLNKKLVLIDHHLSPESYFSIAFSHIPISSTCEMVFRIIKGLGDEHLISVGLAESIYAGIATDTGMFMHSSDNPDLFRIVATLMEKGIDKNKIHSNLFNNFSAHRLKLMGYTFYQKLTIITELSASHITLSRKELKECNFEPGDTEGFVNMPLSIRGIKVSALFSENEDGSIKISFRSVGDFSVNELSKNHFNGGGHKNAAGGKFEGTLKEATDKFEEVLKLHKDEFNK